MWIHSIIQNCGHKPESTQYKGMRHEKKTYKKIKKIKNTHTPIFETEGTHCLMLSKRFTCLVSHHPSVRPPHSWILPSTSAITLSSRHIMNIFTFSQGPTFFHLTSDYPRFMHLHTNHHTSAISEGEKRLLAEGGVDGAEDKVHRKYISYHSSVFSTFSLLITTRHLRHRTSYNSLPFHCCPFLIRSCFF